MATKPVDTEDFIEVRVAREWLFDIWDAAKGDPNRKAVTFKADLGKWHESAMDELFKKGVARLINDYLASHTPAQKVAETKNILAKLNAGDSWTGATGQVVRVPGVAKDPVEVEMLRLAKDQLTARFKVALPNVKKLADMAKASVPVARYYDAAKNVWIDAEVMKYAESKGLRADAEAIVGARNEAVATADLDDLLDL